ncbi:MAG: hypothetical protein ABI395_11880 [Sphingobium sp.]
MGHLSVEIYAPPGSTLSANQQYQGKSYRTFCPLGPVLYLLDPDEGADQVGRIPGWPKLQYIGPRQ